jgi:glycosyltransferase involved in cell wall biosynthesis
MARVGKLDLPRPCDGARGADHTLPRRLTTCCLINHYNYGYYVTDAVESAFAQTVPFDEVILVDDGSDDGSEAVLEELQRRYPELKLIFKENGGQLSCFNSGFQVSSADIVCFLDADDAYEHGYLEALLEIYAGEAEIGFVVSNHRKVRVEGDEAAADLPDRHLGCSLILTLYLQSWVGGPTSCLSIRRGFLEKFMPLPFDAEWKTRADDCLVFGGSLAGASKYFLGRPLVRYRLHGDNYFQGRAPDKLADFSRRVAINRLVGFISQKMGYAEGLNNIAHREFRTRTNPTRREYRDYRIVVLRSNLPLGRKLAMLASMAAYYYLGSERG